MIIGVEGVICAGKSTLVKGLIQAGFASIQEYGVYTKGHGAFPPFPKSVEDAKSATDFFAKVEFERLKSLESLIAEKGEGVNYALDRTYYSCLSFDFALSQCMQFDAFTPSVQIWENVPKIEPSLTIILDIDFDTLLERNCRRGINMLPHFLNRGFAEVQRYYYRELAQLNPQSCLLVDGTLPKEQVEQIVLTHLKGVVR